MARRNQNILPILGAVVGTGLAVYGISRGVRWLQQRQSNLQLYAGYPQSSWPAERRYQPVDQPDREQIPATGSQAAAHSMTGTTTAERVSSDLVSDFDDRGTASSTSEMTGELADEDSYAAGRSAGEPFSAAEHPSSQPQELVMDEYVAPLIEHAIAFNSVMNLLRSRQREGEGYEGNESLTDGDRSSMRAVLDQMQEKVAEYDETVLRKHPLAQRSYNLTRKLRDALDNIEYTGSDLYRINGEVKTELCRLVRDLEQSGQVTITGLDHLRQLYECS
jgi:hypothetical protein